MRRLRSVAGAIGWALILSCFGCGDDSGAPASPGTSCELGFTGTGAECSDLARSRGCPVARWQSEPNGRCCGVNCPDTVCSGLPDCGI